MSHEPVLTFGRSPAQSARGAVLFGLLGSLLAAGLARMVTRPGSPLGMLWEATGSPVWLAYLLGCGLAWGVAGFGFARAVIQRPRFTVSKEGFAVSGTLGHYRIDWDNVREAGVTRTGALGLKLRDREALLATHRGTERQREWLRTMESFGEWDLVYQPAELGAPGHRVLGAILPHLGRA